MEPPDELSVIHRACSFLRRFIAPLGAVALAIAACSSDEPANPGQDGPAAGGASGGSATGGSGGVGAAATGGSGGRAETGGDGANGSGGSAGADEAGAGSGGGLPPVSCGYHDMGKVLRVTTEIALCLPPVVCNPETCPPPLGDCLDGQCIFKAGYKGLETLPEAWVTQYCSLAAQACHGVSQVEFPEITAQKVGQKAGFPLCADASGGAKKCVGIVASSPMVVGNSETAIDPTTSQRMALWGLGMTEASGLCYEITGPGGTALVAVTDRCAGYCKCGGSAYQECGPCVNANDMESQCPCVGTDPGLYGNCCGRGCGTTQGFCDWCSSNNHPHFDVDDDTFKWVCGEQALYGSCKLSKAQFVPCLDPNPRWPANR